MQKLERYDDMRMIVEMINLVEDCKTILMQLQFNTGAENTGR